MSSIPFSFTPAQPLSYADIRGCLPERLRALADQSDACLGLPPRLVAAAGLAHLAACLGRRCLLDDGISKVAPGFNLAVVMDQPQPADWLSGLGRAWTEPAPAPQRLPQPEVPAPADSQAAANQSTLPLLWTPPAPRQPSTPELATSSLEPSRIRRLLAASPDSCLSLVNGAADPAEEWQRLGPARQRCLWSMLSHSWQCKPLETSSQSAAIPGTLCAIWSLRAAAARRLFFTTRHLVSSVPPPLLLIHHGGSCLRYPQVDAPGLIAWQAFLGDLLNERTSAPSEAFPVQLPAAAEQFVQNAALAAAEQPAAIRPWLEWTAELLPRLFMALMIPMTLTINKRRTQKLAELARKYPNAESRETAGYNVEKQAFEKTLPVSIPALAFDHALLLSRWLLQEHCQAVQKLAESRPNAPVTDSTDNTDNDGLMQGILCKLHAHGPLTPRHLQRSFHHLTARERDDAIETLKKQGLVRQSEDGSLAIVS